MEAALKRILAVALLICALVLGVTTSSRHDVRDDQESTGGDIDDRATPPQPDDAEQDLGERQGRPEKRRRAGPQATPGPGGVTTSPSATPTGPAQPGTPSVRPRPTGKPTSTPGGATPKTPTSTPQPSTGVRKLTNGCTLSTRGIPACGTLLGAAYGSNTDPTSWERSMGHALGVRRSYWSGSQVSSAVRMATTDASMRRIPWMSFKLPHSWEQMAAGAGDAWARDLVARLDRVDGPVWLAFHHEPEGEGDIAAWTRMQNRLGPIVRSADNVGFSIVLTGWNNLYGPQQYHLDKLWPSTKVDIAGFDVYERYGAPKDGRIVTEHTDFVGRYFKPFQAFARKKGMAWGLAETGYSHKASTDDPQWMQRTYDQMANNGGVAFSYFNTTLNSTTDWSLSTDTKRRAFASALARAPAL